MTTSAPRIYRPLGGRLAVVESAEGASLADHLRRTAEAVEQLERDAPETEEVTHAGVEYVSADGTWMTLLVIE